MSFFSGCCKCCGAEILNPHTIGKSPNKEEMEWLTQVVAVTPSSEKYKAVIRGTYSGYGAIISNKTKKETGNLLTPKFSWAVDLYHEACWELAGQPLKFTGGSADAPGQGFFVNLAEYERLKPKRTSCQPQQKLHKEK